MDVSGIAAAGTQNANASVQQAAQISLLKQSNDNAQVMAARVLQSTQPARASANPPGIGTLIDVKV